MNGSRDGIEAGRRRAIPDPSPRPALPHHGLGPIVQDAGLGMEPTTGGHPPSPCCRFLPPATECPSEPFHASAVPLLTGSPGCAAPASFPRQCHGLVIGLRYTGGKRRLRVRSPGEGSAQGRPSGGVGFCGAVRNSPDPVQHHLSRRKAAECVAPWRQGAKLEGGPNRP